MGTDKATMILNGKPLVSWVYENASKLGMKVYISVHDKTFVDKISHFVPDKANYLLDLHDGPRSPLLALLSSFSQIEEDYIAVFPVDSPFINADTIKNLFLNNKEFDAIIPTWPDGKTEQIHAIYSRKKILPILKELWAHQKLDLHEILKHTKTVLFIGTETLQKGDPQLLTLKDADTQQEFKILEYFAANTHSFS